MLAAKNNFVKTIVFYMTSLVTCMQREILDFFEIQKDILIFFLFLNLCLCLSLLLPFCSLSVCLSVSLCLSLSVGLSLFSCLFLNVPLYNFFFLLSSYISKL